MRPARRYATNIGIVERRPDLSAYVGEILQTWGLALYRTVPAGGVARLDPAETPVLVLPAGETSGAEAEALLSYVRRGGTLIAFLPRGELAAGIGLTTEGEQETPLRLRVTGAPAAGLAGDLLPVVGRAEGHAPPDGARVLAYLSYPGRFGGETPGITVVRLGQGRVIAFAFDLPLCVLMLRQGDPARAEVLPEPDRCARPSHLASDIGPSDCGWLPFADLLSRLLVDLARAWMPAPVPMLSHLPGSAAGILLYSGDEDGAEVAWNDEELTYVAGAGARMNLYLIPIQTHSTPADVSRYRAHHDVGPHPNLRPLDGEPVSARLVELERQIRLFVEMFGVHPRTMRHHSTAWAGYLEPVEVMARMDIRMDANFFSGCYLRDRQPAPYAAFGGALPMRFCRPDGELLPVFQQHTQISDDVYFSPTADYSYKLSPEQFEVVLDRIYGDIAGRFHTPLGVCIHPSNWVKFSREQGRALLGQAGERGFPSWSFDQWLSFWEARDGLRFDHLTWDRHTLAFRVYGGGPHEALRLLLPASFQGLRLAGVTADGEEVPLESTVRYRETVALVPLSALRTECAIRGRYEER